MLWLFHNLLKLPLLALLPANHQSRLSAASRFRFGPTRQFWLIVGALLLGAGTHLVWDSFTHAGGWSVERLPVLRAPVLQTWHGNLYVFKILQHGSTLLGAALLLVWYRRWFKNSAAQPVELPIQISQPLKSRLICFLLCFPVLLAALYSFSETTAAFEFQSFVRKLVVASVGITMAELVIYSVVWKFKARR